MPDRIVITGIGMVTPLGQDPGTVLGRVQAGESAAAPPSGFAASPFACPVCAEVKEFRAPDSVPEPKMVRLMNRDARLAVAAAHLALRDARLTVGVDYWPEDIGLYGATGMAGLPLIEVAALIRNSTCADGHFDAVKFGQQGLKSISPLLSFKVLANMPLCFVSICENLQGPNGIYTPWEEHGTQAIDAGLRAIENGEAPCVLVGGCDVKTHELAFITLQQLGFFESWKETHAGIVPGEGAVFLVLEQEAAVAARGAPIYARICGEVCSRLSPPGSSAANRPSMQLPQPFNGLVSADEEDSDSTEVRAALGRFLLPGGTILYPKPHVGYLFAAAAFLQVALAAALAARSGGLVLADCRWHGADRLACLLEKP